MIYDMYIIQHLYNPTSEQHQHDIRHSIRHSIYIRYSFNSTLSIVLSTGVYNGINSVVIAFFFFFLNGFIKRFRFVAGLNRHDRKSVV